MKKSILRLTMILLLLATVAAPITAKDKTPKPATEADAAKAKELLTRLDEINAMDKSTLKPSEKRHLRKEVRTIKSELREVGGGVYISVGAILIIILLLIILL